MSAQRTRDDQYRAALSLLITNDLMPRMSDALRFANERYPKNDPQATDFVNGAIYGICSSYMRDAVPEATRDQVIHLYAAVTSVIEELFSDRFRGDFDQLVEHLVPAAFAEGGAA